MSEFEKNLLVLDLGAGSGRAVLATYDGSVLSTRELTRFSGLALPMEDGLHWDGVALLRHVDAALEAAAKATRGRLHGIGVDSWGLDYGLVDGTGRLLVPPYHYRNERGRRGQEAGTLFREEIFRRSGAQDLGINTVYQLLDECRQHTERIRGAERLLMMADFVNHHLTGVARSEWTLARTSGLAALNSQDWDSDLCGRLGIPTRLLSPIMRAGDTIGCLRAPLAAAAGLDEVPVLAVAAHDTASAVAALPLRAGDAFLVCGSWSMLGVEVPEGRLDEPARQAGFALEGGVKGHASLIHSVNGLHLIQKLRSDWQSRTGADISFAGIAASARSAFARGVQGEVDPDDAAFFDPPHIIDLILKTCAAKGQDIPMEIGALALAVYRGLAQQIRQGIHRLSLLGHPVHSIALCGGGARDDTFCRIVADVTGLVVRVGPVEASTYGNAILQLMGLGLIPSLSAGRQLVANSVTFKEYQPADTFRAEWFAERRNGGACWHLSGSA